MEMLNVEKIRFNLKLLTNVETGVKSGTVWWRCQDKLDFSQLS